MAGPAPRIRPPLFEPALGVSEDRVTPTESFFGNSPAVLTLKDWERTDRQDQVIALAMAGRVRPGQLPEDDDRRGPSRRLQ